MKVQILQSPTVYKVSDLQCFCSTYYLFLGGKRGHKGGRKQFSNPQALEASKLKEQKEKEWRRARGEEISDTCVFTRFRSVMKTIFGTIPILRQKKDWMGGFGEWPFFADVQYC